MIVAAQLHLDLDDLSASSHYAYFDLRSVLSDDKFSIQLLRNRRIVTSELCRHLRALSAEEQADRIHTELSLIRTVNAENRFIVVICKCRILNMAHRKRHDRNSKWLKRLRQKLTHYLRTCEECKVNAFLSAHVGDLRKILHFIVAKHEARLRRFEKTRRDFITGPCCRCDHTILDCGANQLNRNSLLLERCLKALISPISERKHHCFRFNLFLFLSIDIFDDYAIRRDFFEGMAESPGDVHFP